MKVYVVNECGETVAVCASIEIAEQESERLIRKYCSWLKKAYPPSKRDWAEKLFRIEEFELIDA